MENHSNFCGYKLTTSIDYNLYVLYIQIYNTEEGKCRTFIVLGLSVHLASESAVLIS